MIINSTISHRIVPEKVVQVQCPVALIRLTEELWDCAFKINNFRQDLWGLAALR